MPTGTGTATAAATHLDPGRGLTERYLTLPDERRLRAVTAGTGDGPLVVFEAGMSAPAASWAHTQREISAHARTLSYDRAGYGGSDLDPHDRTLERIVDDLVALLDGLGERDPVVLVGHSWGGPIIRLFADRYPTRVAGLVFVDATLVEVMTGRNAKVVAASFVVMSLLARLGGSGLIMRFTLPHGAAPEISSDDLSIMTRDYACAQAMRAGRREAAQIIPALPTLRRLQAAGTPDVPTVCLQAGRVERGMQQQRPLFNRTAAELMAAVPNGRAVVVDGAGHLLPQERPAVVREAILDVLAAASRSGTRGRRPAGEM
ncbi:MAG TPA: alpha/beta hydrolase [Mycobacteriales bacterium]|nr:alpha/beta hydrolase [Mycobacteriales bacterium]